MKIMCRRFMRQIKSLLEAIDYWDNIGIMENKMETTVDNCRNIGNNSTNSNHRIQKMALLQVSILGLLFLSVAGPFFGLNFHKF